MVQSLKCWKYEKALRLSLLAFIGVWIFTRHVMFLYLHWALHNALPVTGKCDIVITGRMMLSPGDLGWEQVPRSIRQTRSTICLTPKVKLLLSSISILLQSLFLMWTVEFVHVAVQIHRKCFPGVRGKGDGGKEE